MEFSTVPKYCLTGLLHNVSITIVTAIVMPRPLFETSINTWSHFGQHMREIGPTAKGESLVLSALNIVSRRF